MITPQDIVTILKSGSGCGIDLFNILSVYPLENGKFAVIKHDALTRQLYEHIFTIAEQAAYYFLEQRELQRLGFDFEHGAN